MVCGRCGAENREGSNFCRYCSAPLTDPQPGSGYIPSIPPPPAQAANARSTYYPPTFKTPPQPPARSSVVPPMLCPRCNSTGVVKGTVPLWAILVAVIGAPFTCLLSLFFLLVKDPHRCLNCGLEFK
jgi:DNA-directed RNA polymerase subunit RPC12/RpoP